MKVVCLGGGPAGLTFALLVKKAFPGCSVRVVERNRPDDTFGWGVVFSDETLANFERADLPTYQAMVESFRHWRTIDTWVRGECVRSTGHGFAALSRQRLLLLLQRRCREVGVELEFEREVAALEEWSDAELLVGADGVNSFVRQALAERFRPRLDWRRCKFCWLGTELPLAAFTFIFHESPHGLFQVHAYPFDDRLATWIVECREEVWRRAGLETASEEETIAFCEALFAPYLDGARLLSNRSLWRSFPTVTCERWVDGKVVLLGDAAHTAHFSIGSGTKLAMEDAIALAGACERLGMADLGSVLAAYEAERRPEVARLQRAAQVSLEWFENSARYLVQEPRQFTFNLLTRSHRVTYDNLKARDPELVAAVDRDFAARAASAPADRPAPPPIFTPFALRSVVLANRVVVSPMCQYSAVGGTVGDWHLVHLGSRAIGGAGLVMTEMTNVEPEGRITHDCAGLWTEGHAAAWRRIVEFVHGRSGARMGIQLAHAGRKGSVRHPWQGEDEPLAASEGAWETLAPSALPFRPHWPAPREMDRADMDRVIAAFVRAAELALSSGFDLLELHMAHGYLLSSFLSPLTNRRQDAYGGSLDRRLRFPLEVFAAVRAAWPEERPILVRLSASDWMPDGSGMTPADAVVVARALAAEGCDAVDVSSAGNVPDSPVVYGRMYQVPFAEQIRFEAGVPVAAVGGLLGADHANTVLAAGRADLAVLARAHLRDPYLTLHAAERYEQWEQPWPAQYQPAKPRPRRP
jgi:anthraniloyl-CoA monooxygenase